MIIKTPSDLFAIHQELNEELQLKIIQFYNADKSIILKINALLLAIKKGCVLGKKLNLNTFLVKQGQICVIYKHKENFIDFIDIKNTNKE